MTNPSSFPMFAAISDEVAEMVTTVQPSVVRIDDGSRLTASGLIWTDDGLIVTTSHGVERDEDLVAEMADGSMVPARLLGRDPDTDMALLRLDATGLPKVTRSGEEAPRLGNLTLAVARTGRSGLQITLGVITGRTDTQSNGRNEYVLQTDANLYPGFSGGGLFDASGRLIGLINLMFGQGRGFALGLPIVDHVTAGLLANGRITRGYLGIRTQQVNIPEQLQAQLSPGQQTGLLIAQVETGSPAELGGLVLGDTLLRFDGQAIPNVDALRRLLRQHSAGASIHLTLLRGGLVTETNVILGTEL